MKRIILIAALMVGAMGAKAQTDSTYSFNTGIQNTILDSSVVSYDSVLPITGEGVQRDSEVYHTRVITYPSWIGITPFYQSGLDSPSTVISIYPEEGDGISYVVMRYILFGSCGELHFSNRYRIDGSRFTYYQSQGLQYAYWLIINDPKNHLSKAD